MDDSHPQLGAKGPIGDKICIVGPNGPFFINVIKEVKPGMIPNARPKKKSPGSGNRRRFRLWEKNPHCKYCNRLLEFRESSLDHVIPLSKGGSNKLSNIVLACYKCNKEKADLSPEHYLSIVQKRALKNLNKHKKQVVSRCDLVLL